MSDMEQLKKLREPFPPEQVGKLPKGGATLDFVGHGFLTARLLDVDPMWTWEPMALDERGLPLFDDQGGLWIRLTVCGMTRLGYGDAGGRKGPSAIKEAIGDALRNAAMRFGAALDLWSKGDPDAPLPKSPYEIAVLRLKAVCARRKLDLKAVADRFEADYGVEIQGAEVDTIEAFTAVIADE